MLAGAVGWGAVGALLLVLCWPPFLPWLRLAWRAMRSRMQVDRRPLREAFERLRHFENAHDHHVAGRVLRRLGDRRTALPHLARAVELDPAAPGPRAELGEALLDAGRAADAAAVLAPLVAREPDHAYGETLLLLVQALLRHGDAAAGLAQLEVHHARFGPVRRAAWLRAEAHGRLGDRAARVQALREAAEAPAKGTRMPPADAYVRARARVALWFTRGAP
ncbi:MAG: tetratricopeptide repeat protein [Planctomycetes bacterium]|nr:tetratricopeptide repeat protein [Planctomycetota bacterium]